MSGGVKFSDFTSRIIMRLKADNIPPRLTQELIDRLKVEAAHEVKDLNHEDAKELAASLLVGVITQEVIVATERAVDNMIAQLFKL